MTPPDESQNGHRQRRPPGDLSPLVPGRGGRPSFSLVALRERVERQFAEETAHRADILLDLATEAQRRAALADVADYVLALEAVTLSARDRADLLDAAYRNLFTFGPLDESLNDEAITEITLRGPREIHARRGLGRLEAIPAAFEDRAQLSGILQRVLAGAGVDLDASGPFVEAGTVLAGRPARLSLIAPPVSPDYSLEIRLHPRQPVPLESLVAPRAAALLRAILAARAGLLIVGEAGVGKTTLAGALGRVLPADRPSAAVERAAELVLPAGMRHYVAVPPGGLIPGGDFAGQLRDALDEAPDWLIVDELRGDESAPLWDVLAREDAAAPRCLWVMRGHSQPDRLRSALGMIIRRQEPALPQAAIHRALARHLPFVAAFRRGDGLPRLYQLAEWVLTGPADDPALELRPLLAEQDGEWRQVGRPTRPLDLPGGWGEAGPPP